MNREGTGHSPACELRDEPLQLRSEIVVKIILLFVQTSTLFNARPCHVGTTSCNDATRLRAAS
jgi:hypothetical protein